LFTFGCGSGCKTLALQLQLQLRNATATAASASRPRGGTSLVDPLATPLLPHPAALSVLRVVCCCIYIFGVDSISKYNQKQTDKQTQEGFLQMADGRGVIRQETCTIVDHAHA